MGGAKFVLHANHFRFYDDDGDEASSTAHAAEDANVTLLNLVDRQLHLRYLYEETGGGNGGTIDDYTIEYSVNGAPFVTITATSPRIRTHAGSQLTDGAGTTNRAVDGLTDPAGSFQIGRQEEGDGEITNFQHFANRFTEHVWALDFVAADNAEADVFEFRPIVIPGVIIDDVTAFVTISKPAPRIQRATGTRTGPAASGVGPGPAASAGTGPQAASTARAVGPAGIGSVAARAAAQGSRVGPSSIGVAPGARASGSGGGRARATASAGPGLPRATASKVGPSATGEALDKDRAEGS